MLKYNLNQYNRYEFTKLIGSGASKLAFESVLNCGSISKELPNIIIIFMDDQSYANLSSCGAEGFSTPNVDRMAAESILFTDFYVASSVCSPSVAELSVLETDGKNIQPLLESYPDLKSPHDVIYFYSGNELQRIRNKKWKLYFPQAYQIPVENGNDWQRGQIGSKEMPLTLYDLHNDIEETTNIAAKHPELLEILSQKAKDFDTDLKKNMRTVDKVDL